MDKIEESKNDFISLIDTSKIKIKAKLPYIWVFGGSGENSKRNKFMKWHLTASHDLSKYLKTPEDYPDWANFNQYSNLVDFELDILHISQAIIIFSEQTGAIAEIGMLSYFNELHKNILIIVEEKYINYSTKSFFNLGPIKKIKDNYEKSIYSLDKLNYSDKELNNAFEDISNLIYNRITENENMVKLDKTNKHHITIILIDIIDLFPEKNMKFYKDTLDSLNIQIETSEIKRILDLLELIEVIKSKMSGNNTLYLIRNPKEYTSCLTYQSKDNADYKNSSNCKAQKPKPFERTEFKIRWNYNK